jgi:chromosome segregation ATPase
MRFHRQVCGVAAERSTVKPQPSNYFPREKESDESSGQPSAQTTRASEAAGRSIEAFREELMEMRRDFHAMRRTFEDKLHRERDFTSHLEADINQLGEHVNTIRAEVETLRSKGRAKEEKTIRAGELDELRQMVRDLRSELVDLRAENADLRESLRSVLELKTDMAALTASFQRLESDVVASGASRSPMNRKGNAKLSLNNREIDRSLPASHVVGYSKLAAAHSHDIDTFSTDDDLEEVHRETESLVSKAVNRAYRRPPPEYHDARVGNERYSIPQKGYHRSH